MELIVRHGDREERIRLEPVDGGYRVTVGDRRYEVDVAPSRSGLLSLVVSGRQHEVTARPLGDGRYRVATAAANALVEVMDPLTHLARTSHGSAAPKAGIVHALMPGRVVEILAAEGDDVEPGRGILVVEAMKMKNEIQAEGAGVLRRICVEVGQAVEAGDALFEIG